MLAEGRARAPVTRSTPVMVPKADVLLDGRNTASRSQKCSDLQIIRTFCHRKVCGMINIKLSSVKPHHVKSKNPRGKQSRHTSSGERQTRLRDDTSVKGAKGPNQRVSPWPL